MTQKQKKYSKELYSYNKTKSFEYHKEVKLSKKAQTIVSVIIVLIIIIGSFFLIMSIKNGDADISVGAKNGSTTITNNEGSDKIKDLENYSLDHSGSLLVDPNSISDMSSKDLGYKVVELNTIGKVEKALIEEGLLDGTMYSKDETFQDYVANCFDKKDQSNIEKFYCAMYKGEDDLCQFVYDYMKQNNLLDKNYIDESVYNNASNTSGTGISTDNGTSSKNNKDSYQNYFYEYYKIYFADVNSLDTNEDLKAECISYLQNISRDSKGFYTNMDVYSFTNHIENCSKYVPSNGSDYYYNSKTGESSFIMHSENKDTRYYFHQTDDGIIYYSENKEESDNNSQERITYLNRFDNSDFVYFEDKVSANNIDTEALLNKGYRWDSTNSLIKEANGKTHKVSIIN